MERSNWFSRFVKSKALPLIILYIIIAVVFSFITKGKYLSWFNIRNILNTIVGTAYLTIGAVFLMISGHVDLSTGQVATVSGVVMASLLLMGLTWWEAVLAVLVMGALIGFINAVLINEFKFQAFVITLAVSYIAQGFTYLMTKGTAVEMNDPVLSWIGTYKIGGSVPIAVVITLIIYAIYGFILAKTRFGKTIYLAGGNPMAAKLSGLNPKRLTYVLFINNAVLGALAGMLLAARLESAAVTGIANGQFAGITGALLGGVSFGGGMGGMGGAFVGLVLMNGFNSGLGIVGLGPYWQTFASGALLVGALTLDFFYTKRLSSAK